MNSGNNKYILPLELITTEMLKNECENEQVWAQWWLCLERRAAFTPQESLWSHYSTLTATFIVFPFFLFFYLLRSWGCSPWHRVYFNNLPAIKYRLNIVFPLFLFSLSRLGSSFVCVLILLILFLFFALVLVVFNI